MHCGAGSGISVSKAQGGDFPTMPWGCLPSPCPVTPEWMFIVYSGRKLCITLCWLIQRAVVSFHSLSFLNFKGLWPSPAKSFSSTDLPVPAQLTTMGWTWSDLGIKRLGPPAPSTMFNSFLLLDKPFNFPEPQFSHLKQGAIPPYCTGLISVSKERMNIFFKKNFKLPNVIIIKWVQRIPKCVGT